MLGRSFSTSGRKRAFHLQLLLPLAGAVGWFCTSSLRYFLETELGWWGQVQQIPACLKIALSGESSSSAPGCCSSAWAAGMAALPGGMADTFREQVTENLHTYCFLWSPQMSIPRDVFLPWSLMKNQHQRFWRLLKMLAGELEICSFIPKTEFTFLVLTIIKVASFTFKKNKVFLFGSISSSSFIPSLFHEAQRAVIRPPRQLVPHCWYGCVTQRLKRNGTKSTNSDLLVQLSTN